MTEFMQSSSFIFTVENRHTVVLCASPQDTQKFHTSSVETGELRPHGDDECDCADSHPTSFRLKTIIRKLDGTSFTEMLLYISLEQNESSDVECQVIWHDCTLTRVNPPPSTHDNYPGWKYLININFLMSSSSQMYFFYNKNKKTLEPNLLSNLSELLMDGTYSDVTVTSSDGSSIKAHRGILAKRSEVFRGALEHNETKDQITSHLNEETLRQIMTYIYTDNTPKIGDFTADLFVAADYYQLLHLKDVCVTAFCKQLKVENAIATLELAEQHSLTDLQTSTLAFIKENIESIVKTDDWINIKSLSLVKMICEFNAQKSISNVE